MTKPGLELVSPPPPELSIASIGYGVEKKIDLICLKFAYGIPIAGSLWEATPTVCGTFLIFPPNKIPVISFLLPNTFRGTQASIAQGQPTPEKSDKVDVPKSKPVGL